MEREGYLRTDMQYYFSAFKSCVRVNTLETQHNNDDKKVWGSMLGTHRQLPCKNFLHSSTLSTSISKVVKKKCDSITLKTVLKCFLKLLLCVLTYPVRALTPKVQLRNLICSSFSNYILNKVHSQWKGTVFIKIWKAMCEKVCAN